MWSSYLQVTQANFCVLIKTAYDVPFVLPIRFNGGKFLHRSFSHSGFDQLGIEKIGCLSTCIYSEKNIKSPCVQFRWKNHTIRDKKHLEIQEKTRYFNCLFL